MIKDCDYAPTDRTANGAQALICTDIRWVCIANKHDRKLPALVIRSDGLVTEVLSSYIKIEIQVMPAEAVPHSH